VSGRKARGKAAPRALLAKSEYRKISNEQIEIALRPFGIAASPALARSIAAYITLLLRWNEKVNLTAITEPQQILERHFGESLFARSLFAEENGLLVDVGSGAGFPGLALKLVLPDWQVQLLEPNVKKATFLAEVVRTLGLAGVSILSERMGKSAVVTGRSVSSVDVITARALGDYDQLLDWAMGLLLPEGRVILWVGGAEASRLQRNPDWVWQDCISVPGSKDRFLLVGSPKT
jgi:16S rRNA (guanine527-N7)-methyltransferase